MFIAAALIGLIVAAVAVFPWTPGFTTTIGGVTLTAHTLGNLAGILLALSSLGIAASGSKGTSLLEKIDEDPSPRWDRLLPWGMFAAYLVVSGSLKIRQHALLQTHGSDLGVAVNTCWNTLHGRWLWSSFHGASHLAIHADLVLALLAPFLLLPHQAEVMVLIQSFGLAVSLPAVYLITRDITTRRSLALAAMLLFAGNPFILDMAQFDFHPEPLSIPLFLWAIVALRDNRWGAFWTLIAVILTIKEDMSLVVAAWGISILLFDRERRTAGALCLLAGLSFFFLDTQIIIRSHLPPGTAHHLISRYGYLGKTYPEIFRNLLVPEKLEDALLVPWQKPWAVFRLLAWLLFLPLISPIACLPAAAAILPHLLSNFNGQYMLTGSYPCAAFPFLFFALAEAMNRLGLHGGYGDRARRFLGAAVVAAGLGMVFSPRFVDAADTDRLASAYRMFKLVPEGASLRAQCALYAHLALRQHIQSFPIGAHENDEFSSLENPDYIALDLTGDSFPFTHSRYVQAITKMETDGDYEKVFDEKGFQLWKRKNPGTPIYTSHVEPPAHESFSI